MDLSLLRALGRLDQPLRPLLDRFPCNDAERLYALSHSTKLYYTHQRTAARLALHAIVKAWRDAWYVDPFIEHPCTMLVEESGRDCDCVEYSGKIHEIPATVKAFDALYDDIANWADGPFHLTILHPNQTPPAYQSRDLVLEAMEDGHPHSIVSRYP